MKYTRWVAVKGGRIHLKTPSDWRYLCGRRAAKYHQQVFDRLDVCGTCLKVKKIIDQKGYRPHHD